MVCFCSTVINALAKYQNIREDGITERERGGGCRLLSPGLHFMNLKVRAKPHGKICDVGARSRAYQGLHFAEERSWNISRFSLSFVLSLIGRLRGEIYNFSPK